MITLARSIARYARATRKWGEHDSAARAAGVRHRTAEGARLERERIAAYAVTPPSAAALVNWLIFPRLPGRPAGRERSAT